jgi:hypothetical protein
MPTLKEYRADFYTFSGKLSDVSRQLAFAAIAIIWLFKSEAENRLSIPRELVLPGVLVVCSLSFDLLQYCWASITWYFVYRGLEKRGLPEDEQQRQGVWLERPISIIFWVKVGLIMAAYILILVFLFRILRLR